MERHWLAATRYAPRMLWVIVGVLVLLWVLGLVLRAFGGVIHILIIAALVVVIYRLVTRGRIR
jgi:hypothetical protein